MPCARQFQAGGLEVTYEPGVMSDRVQHQALKVPLTLNTWSYLDAAAEGDLASIQAETTPDENGRHLRDRFEGLVTFALILAVLIAGTILGLHLLLPRLFSVIPMMRIFAATAVKWDDPNAWDVGIPLHTGGTDRDHWSSCSCWVELQAPGKRLKRPWTLVQKLVPWLHAQLGCYKPRGFACGLLLALAYEGCSVIPAALHTEDIYIV
ncbi:hypothetical protein PG993_000906 [Apiospora rasikravindrae]|uniref:Uncharacterized protein n=1 Tax=Apiospora rasikravindrae TaxID=990691 RepID=A0ABR1U9W6_9PEZI